MAAISAPQDQPRTCRGDAPRTAAGSASGCGSGETMTDRLTRTRALESSGTQSDAAERIATEIDNPLDRQPVGSGTEGEQHSPRAIDQAPHGEEPLVRATKRLVAATKVLAVVGALGFGAALLQWLALRSTDEKVSQEVTALQGQVAALNNIPLRLEQVHEMFWT